MTPRAPWNDEELDAFEAGLTAENLSAIMRSTWTWDDRALRRDLAGLLTRLRAVSALEPGGAVHGLVRRRTLQAAAGFLAAVLGPRVIADSGHPTSYSFAQTLVRSPWLTGAAEHERLLTELGAETIAALPDSDLAALDASTAFATTLAAHALAASGDESAGAAYLAKIEAGALSATLAAAESSGSWDPALVRTRARRAADGWVLDGEKLFVPHADTSDVLFVVARSTAGPSLYAVDAGAPGLTAETMATIDPTRPLARVSLRQVPAVLLGVEGAGGRLMGRVLDLASVSLAEEQVAGTRRCLEVGAAVSPDAERHRQYGELRLDLEVAAALANSARVAVESGDAEAGIAAAMAHIGCSQAFTRVARAVVPLAAETGADDAVAEAGRLFLRAQSSDLLFGGPALYYERLLERMGI
jgi:alkylation response protein AidB-like acyl-CoA dehydrogenase